jgi:hypothetical protein
VGYDEGLVILLVIPVVVPIVMPIVLGLMVAGSLLYAWYRGRDRTIKRALRAIARTDVGRAEDGQVQKLVGKVRFLSPPLEAPLTGRPCTYFCVVVEERVLSGRETQWQQVLREERGQDFELDDGSGRALVEIRGAEVAIVSDAKFRTGVSDDPTPRMQAFFEHHRMHRRKGFTLRKLRRFREGVLEDGEQVAASGQVSLEVPERAGDADDGYRSAPARQPVLRSKVSVRLLVTDDPSVTGS